MLDNLFKRKITEHILRIQECAKIRTRDLEGLEDLIISQGFDFCENIVDAKSKNSLQVNERVELLRRTLINKILTDVNWFPVYF